jgi:predicted CDP-diglyceride synthetase/phosphatidate cytidylyltransferase
MMFTTVSVASAIAVIVALATGHGSSALAALLIGLVTFAGQFLIGNVRRDAT